MIRGNMFVFEGIDGSGTTTQAAEARKRFEARGLPAQVTAEPSSGPIGSQIRQILSGRLVVPRRGGSAPFDWQTMALLFAADRQDHIAAKITPNLNDGVNIICDRYVHSSVIYQSVSSGKEDAASWIKECNRYARNPDLVFYLKIDPTEAVRRCRQRDTQTDMFDDPELQRLLALAYDNIESYFPEHSIVTIDAGQSVDDIADECWQHIEKLRMEGAPS